MREEAMAPERRMESGGELAGSEFFSTLDGPTRFVILRHGQSEGNARRIIQGRLDLPLDDDGRAQALALGRWLAGEGCEAILCSPLARAAETASIIARETGLARPETSELFAELETGIFTGLSLEEAARRHPEAAHAFERKSWDGVPGAENSAALYARAMEAWRLLRSKAEAPAAAPEDSGGRGAASASGGRARLIAVVSHGGFIQWLVRASFGCRSWMPLYTTGNCGVFELFAEPVGPEEPAYCIWRRIDWRAPELVAKIAPVF